MSKHLILFFPILLFSCTKLAVVPKAEGPKIQKEFSRGELILASILLNKIFDQEMAQLACVPDADEAALLLRTIRPRMEIIEDDLEALLDDRSEVTKLINTCEQNCTCSYVDDLLREHQVTLLSEQKKTLKKKSSDTEVNRCLNFSQTTFCQSELYKTLNEEKEEFTYEEDL